MNHNFLWEPSSESIRKTNLYTLMQEQRAAKYAEIHAWSVENPEAFWERTMRALDIRLRKPYSQLLDVSDGVAHAKWLAGAQLNIAESCFNAAPDSSAIL